MGTSLRDLLGVVGHLHRAAKARNDPGGHRRGRELQLHRHCLAGGGGRQRGAQGLAFRVAGEAFRTLQGSDDLLAFDFEFNRQH